jgi:hypothetical protein
MSRALALSLLALSACTPPPVSVRPPQPPAQARDYGRIYDRWTRVGRVHSWKEMDTTLLVMATLRGPEFQQAFAARYAALYRLGEGPDKTRFLDELRQADEGALAFLVRAAGHNWRWSDLAPDKGYWRMTLADASGAEVAPAKVEAVHLRRESIENELYGGGPAGPLVRFYHVTFPKQGPGGQPLLRPGQLTLRLSGPQGRADLSWTLKE